MGSSADSSPHHRKQLDETGGATVSYEDEYEKINAKLQVAWSIAMDQCNYYKMPSFYRKTKCLLISWDDDSDDLHTSDEVRSLKLKICELTH